MLQFLLMIVLFLTALFLIVLVLLQRGKGGGLTGALGGLGGQSAFGTKAGDLFTRITIGVATFWILLCILTVKLTGTGTSSLLDSDMGSNSPANQTQSAPSAPQKTATPAGEASSSASAAPAKPAETPPSKP